MNLNKVIKTIVISIILATTSIAIAPTITAQTDFHVIKGTLFIDDEIADPGVDIKFEISEIGFSVTYQTFVQDSNGHNFISHAFDNSTYGGMTVQFKVEYAGSFVIPNDNRSIVLDKDTEAVEEYILDLHVDENSTVDDGGDGDGAAIIEDPFGDVYVFDYASEDLENLTITDEKPNIDIKKVTYAKNDGSTEVTLTFEVYGNIEDKGSLDSEDLDSLNLVSYGLSLSTSQDTYEINYINQTCQLSYSNYTVVNITDFSVDGGNLTIQFDLLNADETYEEMVANTVELIFSGEVIGYYMDTAPDHDFIFNDAPNVFDEYPANGSTDIERPPDELSVNVEDIDGDPIDVYIRWKNHDGEWVTLETYTGISNGIRNISIMDCIDVHYIGRYASNNTIFDSSYEDAESKTGGTPLQMFVSTNKSAVSPKSGYIGIIEGLAEGLVGLKENTEATIGPIPPEKAYGAKKLGIGDTFSTINLALEMNQTVQVTDLTSDFIDLKWINMENLSKFTMPKMILKNLSSTDQNEMLIFPPPYYIWENSTEIINITDETVTVKTTPTASENLSETIEPVQYSYTVIMFIFPDATTATWNETTITITSSPEIGKSYLYSQDTGYGYATNMTFTIESIVNDTINISVMYEGSDERLYQEVNSTIEFNRTFVMPRLYNNIPLIYQEYLIGEDLQREGYSLHELAGESLIFEVKIVKVYKTSQYHTYSFVPSGNDWSWEDTTYFWSVNVTDGTDWTNKTYYFTTGSKPQDPPHNPPPPTNQNPVADASAGEPYQGFIGEEIAFDGSLSYDPDTEGHIVTWYWSYGDGTNGTGETTKHRYYYAGTYTATLTVADNEDAENTYETTVLISQPNRPPSKPSINGSTTGNKNTEYIYTATSTDPDNDTIKYSFIWGDQTSYVSESEFLPSGSVFTANHIWTVAGKYTITVTTTDNKTISETSKLTVLIDVVNVEDIGYFIDVNGDGIYDSFHNDTSNQDSDVEYDDGKYLVDDNGDGEWDFTYSMEEGLKSYEKEETSTPGFGLILVVCSLAIVIFWKRKRNE